MSITAADRSPLAELARRYFQPEYGLFIGGQWVGGDSGRTIPILSPVTGEEISRIVAGNAVDAARAVDAAHEVFRTWGRTSPYERQAAASSPPTSRGKGMVINLEDGLIGLFG